MNKSPVNSLHSSRKLGLITWVLIIAFLDLSVYAQHKHTNLQEMKKESMVLKGKIDKNKDNKVF